MIIKAEHIENYILKVTFKEGQVKLIDLKEAIYKSKHPSILYYKDVEKFKEFHIDHGILFWNNNQFDICPRDILNGKYDLK